jgi:hypothetical protein
MSFSDPPLTWLVPMSPSAPLVATMRVDLEGGGWRCGAINVDPNLGGGGVELRRWQNRPKSLPLFRGGNGSIGLGFIWGVAMWSRAFLDLFCFFIHA